MDNELIILNKKIKSIIEEKELPNNIKEKIENIYQEYKNIYDEYLKNEGIIDNQKNEFLNFEECFEENYLKTIATIQDKYKERCREKSEVLIIVLSTLESQKSIYEDEQMEESERDILSKCVKNDRENYIYINNIIDIVINSVKNIKKELFKTLELLKTTEQKIAYIDAKIKLIENSAKLKLGLIKTDLNIQDEQIFKQILFEYEQYKEEKRSKQKQNIHQKFAKKYKVQEEKLQTSQKIGGENLKEKEHENLTDNVIK